MTRRILRLLTIVALVYSAAMWLLFAFPFWRLVPGELLMPVSAHACPSGSGYRMLYEADPALRAKILPVVMASRGDRGSESEISQWSCDRIAASLRDAHPVLTVVPQRFLCQSLRRHVRELYRDAHHNIGPPLWIVDDRAVGPVDLHRVLSAKGIAYTDRGLEVREPRSDASLEP